MIWINDQGAGDENSKYISFPYCFLEQIIIPLHFISAGLPSRAAARCQHARMAESVDALVSNTNVRKDVPVRPRLRVPPKEVIV